tara:strand:- start:199 stop:633 length:435 start_codon:yes stop_codon:yes gene_type:complete
VKNYNSGKNSIASNKPKILFSRINFFNKFGMIVRKFGVLTFVVITLCIFLTGCAGQPYINIDNEFNRDSKYYLQGQQSRNNVEVCYNTRSSTPKQIIEIASKECMRFGKRAKFSKNSYTICPIRTPVAAIYECYNPNKDRAFIN